MNKPKDCMSPPGGKSGYSMMLMEVESGSGAEMWGNMTSPDDDSDEPLASLLEKNGASAVECEHCGKQMGSKFRLRQHMKRYHGKKKRRSFACGGCDRTFSCESSLRRHKSLLPEDHGFSCELCGQSFLKREIFLKHKRIKHPVPRQGLPVSSSIILPNSCSHCGLVLENEDELQVHSAEKHGDFSRTGATWSCADCLKSFVSEEGLRYHEKHMHRSQVLSDQSAVENLKCKICCEVLSTKPALRWHLKTHNAKKNVKPSSGNYKCLICPRTFSSSDGIKYHLAIHTGERRFACDICKKKFIKKTHLSEHMATHTNTKSYSCERCPRSFNTHTAFQKHCRTFPGPHNFFCSKCGKVFMKESMLEKHLCVDMYSVALAPEVVSQLSEDVLEEYLCMAEEADQEEKQDKTGLSCYKCFKLLPTAEALEEHQQEHVGKQVYPCRFCAQVFHRTDEFSTHIANHIGKTPYMCRQCNRKFISPFTLATHLKNYPGEHSFSCTRCKRWFPSPDRLEKHDCILQNVDVFVCACSQKFGDWESYMKHFGSKPFKCCSCSQEFVALLPLTRHVKSHTGQRPFACQLCQKTFLTKVNLHAHLKVHDQSRSYSCSECAFTTRQKRWLDTHLLSKHNITSVGQGTVCPVCGVLITEIQELQWHIQSEHENVVTIKHEGKGSLPSELCTLCGKMLKNKYSLVAHIAAVHEGEKKRVPKYECETCGDQLSSSRQLKQHLDQHELPSPRPCPTCGLIFNTNKELRKHERKHDTSKPFSCQQCGKMFKVAGGLKYHSTICGKKPKKIGQDADVVYDYVAEPDQRFDFDV